MLNFPPDPNISSLPYNSELSLAALNFKHAIENLDQYGFGHILTGLSHSVVNSNPQFREMIQQNVDTMKRGFLLLGYCSVWDHYFNRNINANDQKNISEQLLYDPCNPAEHWVSENDSLRFRALKHIRHSVAHSFNGLRAKYNRSHFETVMASSAPFRGVTFDDENIDISNSQIDHDARELLQSIASYLAARLINNNPFKVSN